MDAAVGLVGGSGEAVEVGTGHLSIMPGVAGWPLQGNLAGSRYPVRSSQKVSGTRHQPRVGRGHVRSPRRARLSGWLMPTFETLPWFERDWKNLTARKQATFRKVVMDAFVPDLTSADRPFRSGLRVKSVTAHPSVVVVPD